MIAVVYTGCTDVHSLITGSTGITGFLKAQGIAPRIKTLAACASAACILVTLSPPKKKLSGAKNADMFQTKPVMNTCRGPKTQGPIITVSLSTVTQYGDWEVNLPGIRAGL